MNTIITVNKRNKAHFPTKRKLRISIIIKMRPRSFFCINSLFIPEFNKELKHMSQPNFIVNKRLNPNPIKARISQRNSVPLWYLNHMNILITIFPFRDVVNSNVPPFIHMNGSHPIGDFS
jgi:hypothetical protein